MGFMCSCVCVCVSNMCVIYVYVARVCVACVSVAYVCRRFHLCTHPLLLVSHICDTHTHTLTHTHKHTHKHTHTQIHTHLTYLRAHTLTHTHICDTHTHAHAHTRKHTHPHLTHVRACKRASEWACLRANSVNTNKRRMCSGDSSLSVTFAFTCCVFCNHQ